MTLVSPWPISSKILDITPIHFEGHPEVISEPKEEAPQEKEKEKAGKETKGKKEGKVKVKQVK